MHPLGDWGQQGRVVSINQGRRGGTRVWVVNQRLNYQREGTLCGANIELETIYTASIEEENNARQNGELVNPSLIYRREGETLCEAIIEVETIYTASIQEENNARQNGELVV